MPLPTTQEELDTLIAERLASETEGLKKNRDQLLKEKKAADAKLSAYDGIDPEEHKTLKAAAAEAERKRATADGDFKALEKQLIDRHQAELTGRDTKIGKLTKAIEKQLIDATLTKELVAGGAKPKMIDLLALRGKDSLRVRETDDGFEYFVADAKGNPLVADGKGTAMTVADLVSQTLKTQYPDAFEGSGASGGGASKSAGGAGGNAVVAGDGQSFLAGVKDVASGKATVQTQ